MPVWTRIAIYSLVVGCLCLLSVPWARALTVGDLAPEFTLPATVGEQIRLTDYRGKRPVVVFFYIAAFGRS